MQVWSTACYPGVCLIIMTYISNYLLNALSLQLRYLNVSGTVGCHYHLTHRPCFCTHFGVKEKATSITSQTWKHIFLKFLSQAFSLSKVQAKDTRCFNTRWTEINTCQQQQMESQDLVLLTWHPNISCQVILLFIILLLAIFIKRTQLVSHS